MESCFLIRTVVSENGILLHLMQMLLKFLVVLHFIGIKMHLISSVTQVGIIEIIPLSHYSKVPPLTLNMPGFSESGKNGGGGGGFRPLCNFPI